MEQLIQALDVVIAEKDFSGAVMLKQGGKVIYEKAAGFAHRAYRVKNTLDTRFGTASVTKAFTAVAVMQLIDEGRLALDTRVVDLLGLEETAILPDVTVEHLLTHTSGIADYFDETEEDDDYTKVWEKMPNYAVKELKDMLPLFVHNAPKAQPGEEVAYSNAAFILLGLVIEKVTGRSYFDQVRESVFRRANMEGADFLTLDGVHERMAEGYMPLYDEDEKVIGYQRNIFTLPNVGASDGGAYVTVEDLCCFLQALREEKLLSSAGTKAFLQPRVLDETYEGSTFYYGLGLYFQLKDDKMVRYGNPGEDPGFSCRMYHCPGLDLDFAVASNITEGVLPVMMVIMDYLESQS